MTRERLLAIDLQRIFAAGPWSTPGFDTAANRVLELADTYDATFTRFVAPAEPAGAWRDYYAQWPFALQPPDAPGYRLDDRFAAWTPGTVDATTFGKWDALAERLQPRPGDRFLVAGVSTDCCVLSTVLAAADAGMFVRVVADACAGLNEDTHRAALDVMALYAPQVEIVTTADVLPVRQS